MKKLVPIIIIFVLGIVGISFLVSFKRVEAGYVGIKVNLYGNETQAQDIKIVSGWVFYNPLSTKVYQFPTFIQHKVWTSDRGEDNDRNEEFTVITKDGLIAKFNVGLDYKVVREKVPEIFRTYRKTLDEITNQFIRTLVRNAYNSTASQFEAGEMVSKRASYEDQVRVKLLKDMEKAGFDVTQVAIVGKILLPETIEVAINAKIQAVQEAMRAENQKQKVVAEAAKLVEEAKGIAASMKIRAEAEAEANKIVSQSITALLVQKQMIEKWDGKLPVYGEVPKLFRNIDSK